MKKKTMGIIVLLVVIVSTLFSGCGNKNETNHKTATVFLIGNRACNAPVNLSSETVRTAAANTVYSYGMTSAIAIDGFPEIDFSYSYELPKQYANANRQKLEADAEVKTLSLLSELYSIKAVDPEADVLESLRLAVRSLSAVDDSYEKNIVVIDSGLNTTGILNFCNNIITAEPSQVAEELESKSAIPDFSGVKVLWMQMGDVCEPQQSLSPAQLVNLKNIWSAIIEKTGGVLEIHDDPTSKATEKTEYPKVSTIDLPKETPIAYEAKNDFTEPQFLSEEQCQFLGDSDVYVNPEKVYETVSPIAEYMINKPTFKILLIGTTAGDTDNFVTEDLSRRRAEAVKATLIELGVSEKNIISCGLGSSDPWHIYGVGIEGPLAAQNRKVVLIDADSDTAQEIIGKN